MISKKVKKYYRMYFDLFAVLSSIILIVVLILMFGLPIYAASDTWVEFDWDNPQPILNNTSFGAGSGTTGISIVPFTYDQTHYNDLIDGLSGTWYSAYNHDSVTDITRYNSTFYATSYTAGAYTYVNIPFDSADYLIYGLVPAKRIYMIKTTVPDQKIYIYDNLLVSDNNFKMCSINVDNNYIAKGTFSISFTVNLNSDLGLYYYDFTTQGTGFKFGNANFPILFDNRVQSYSNLDRLIYFADMFNDSNLVSALNNDDIKQYNADDYPAFDFPATEGSQNNLYLPSCNWSFRVPTYFAKRQDSYYNANIANILNGYIDFNVELTDYQKEHLEDFSLDVNFSFVSRCHAGSTLNNGTYSDFKSYYAYGVYSGSTSISFDDFVNGQYTWALSDLFNDTSLTSCNVPTDFNSQVGTIFSTFVRNLYFENLSPFAFTGNDEFCVYCSASVSANNISSQGKCNSVYDFVGGKSKNNYNNLNYNFEPFVPEDDLDNTSEPDNNSTEIVTSDGNVSLINYDNDNNNQSIIIEDSSPEFADGLINRLIPINSDAGLSNDFVNMVRLNSWLPFVSSVYSFFPSIFVDSLTNYFVTIIGILCVAFVLWLLVHIF